MVITKLFYGLNEIIRIYKDNVIIWESTTRISLAGYSEIKTYTMGTGYTTSEIVFAGLAEIDTYGKGVLMPVVVFRLYGDEESNVNGLGDLYAAPVATLEGTAESLVYGLSEVRLLPAVSSSSDVEIVTLTVGEGVALGVVNGGKSDVYIPVSTSVARLYVPDVVLGGGETDIIVRTKGNGEALNIVPVPIREGVEILTYQIADAHALDIVNSEGASESDVYVKSATLIGLSILDMGGNAVIVTYANGEARVLNSVEGVGSVEIETHTDGTVRDLDTVETTSEVEVETDTTGKLSIWYLPFIDTDGTLYIRQAYSAQVVDGVLEVS